MKGGNHFQGFQYPMNTHNTFTPPSRIQGPSNHQVWVQGLLQKSSSPWQPHKKTFKVHHAIKNVQKLLHMWVQDPSQHMQGCVSSCHLTTRETIHHHQPSSRDTKTSRAWRTSSRVQFHQGLHQVQEVGSKNIKWHILSVCGLHDQLVGPSTSSMFHKCFNVSSSASRASSS